MMQYGKQHFWQSNGTLRRCVPLVLFCITAISLPAVPQSPLKIVGGAIPYVLHPDFPGPHNDIFFDVLSKQATNNSHDIRILPYARALRDFLAKKLDCLYPTIDNTDNISREMLSSGKVRFSRAVNALKLYAFTPKTATPIRTLEDMRGKTIVGTEKQLEAMYPSQEHYDLTFLYVIDQVKSFELLDRGRADIAVTYGMDAYATMHDRIEPITHAPFQKLDGYTYDPGLVLLKRRELLACWTNTASHQFIDEFNDAIEQLEHEGRLAKIFNVQH